MTEAVAASAEAVGPQYSVDGMLQARAKTREVIRHIAQKIEPGMLEEDAVILATQTLLEAGLSQTWHPTRVRFGANTTRAMKQRSEPGVILKENDIFFIDMAPRFMVWEGDGGESFVVGNNVEHARCAHDARELFHEVRLKWDQERWSGKQLYEYADRRARQMGWELNFDLPGHRVSDFPHAAIYTGALANADFPPSPALWVLEIHIRHPEKPFGAFYEDLLLDDEFYQDA